MQEIWRDIKGYEGLYQVSNLGRIKNVKTKSIKVATKCKNGYLYIDLYKNNKRTKKTVHRIVAETFLDNKDGFTDINHIDGNKLNNNVNNLEFCNRSYNLKEAYRLKLRKIAKPMLNKKDYLCPTSKKVNQYDMNGNFIREWGSTMQIERELKIRHSSISACCLKNRKYKTVGGYKWEYVGVKNSVE